MDVFDIPSLEWIVEIAIKGVVVGTTLRLAEYVLGKKIKLKEIWVVFRWWFSTWPHSIIFGMAFSLLVIVLLPIEKFSEVIVSSSVFFMAVFGSFLAHDLRSLLSRFKG